MEELTINEAIEYLKKVKGYITDYIVSSDWEYCQKLQTAIDMGISALEAV